MRTVVVVGSGVGGRAWQRQTRVGRAQWAQCGRLGGAGERFGSVMGDGSEGCGVVVSGCCGSVLALG